MNLTCIVNFEMCVFVLFNFVCDDEFLVGSAIVNSLVQGYFVLMSDNSLEKEMSFTCDYIFRDYQSGATSVTSGKSASMADDYNSSKCVEGPLEKVKDECAYSPFGSTVPPSTSARRRLVSPSPSARLSSIVVKGPRDIARRSSWSVIGVPPPWMRLKKSR